MEGEKLTLVRQTIDFLAANVLRATDELAIVAYDDKIEDALPLQRMDAQGVERAHKAISRITARGSTNLSGGLFRGLELMQASSEADVTAVLLFTDGLANQGVTDLQTIAAETHALSNSAAKRPSVFTFGFGSDHDENMLRAIAEAAAGTYYFVKGKDDIPQAFGDCFGGLVSVVAQNIRLRFESLSPSVVLNATVPTLVL
jgi:Mg-chelatase subunit ChlD